MKNILVIDDDTYICDLLVEYLNKNGYRAEGKYSGVNAKKAIENKSYDLILCDFRLPDSDGLKLLQAAKKSNPFMPVVIMTAYTDLKMAVKLIKLGAFDYVSKPINHEEILRILKKAFKTFTEDPNGFKEKFVVGQSSLIKDVMDHVNAVAPTDITILIQGETGTGKEYLARTVHYSSKRKDKPFIPVDCGALPKDLANSELFGHIKGSFTGAIKDKKGLFEQANGGTLFLDEVGNLTHEIQVKLLRALQEKVINKVGDDKNVKINVRVIAASNDNLRKEVDNNNFREDLYHRLNGFKINLPSLKRRGEDVILFANHFLKSANQEFEKDIIAFDNEVLHIFKNYHWPGNIRELKNIINRSVILTKNKIIEADVLPEEIRNSSNFNQLPQSGIDSNVLKNATSQAERVAIIEA